MSELLKRLRKARASSVPLVSIETPDPAATMKLIAENVCNRQPPVPCVAWDIVRGVLPVNNAGESIARETGEGDADTTTGDPVLFLTAAAKFPARIMVFLINAHNYIEDVRVQQAVWNLRDQFKVDLRMLILLGPSMTFPPTLKDDVVSLDEPLPSQDQLAVVVREQEKAAGACSKCGGTGIDTGLECQACKGKGRKDREALSDGVLRRSVEAVTGLSAFGAEQAIAMSLTHDGIDIEALWEAKRKQIELTPGLSVWRGAECFDDIGGLARIKRHSHRILGGKRPPSAVVWIDEIEKMLAGAEGRLADSSGVSQGILQAILSHMQDHNGRGFIFLGPPGTGKSLLAKALGKQAGVPTIAWDSNAMKGGLVGQSEANVRTALKVISAISNDNALWVATCNSMAGIPTALRRRFSYGTFFFDLPDTREKSTIWKYYTKTYDLSQQQIAKRPTAQHWTGAEIRTCCELSWDLDMTLEEAGAEIIPVAQADPKAIDELRGEAAGRYASASYEGVYRKTKAAARGGRTIDTDN